jgi:Flp pilus assembly protein TadG
MKTLLRDESGQTLIFVAVSMTVILGFLAMAADVGTLLHDRRNLQIAADSAAIAGAVEEKVSSVTGDIQTSGQTASTQNGFTNGSNGVTVTINTPPASGPHAGAAGYVEAIVSQVEPVFFTKLRGFTTMTVTTRAVAFNGATSTNCVLAINPTAAQTIELQGSFNANFPGCSVVDDSNDPDALDFTGGGGSLTAGSVGVVGGAGGHTGDSTPAPKTGIAPISDPFASLPAPPYDPASCTAAPTGTAWGPATPGGTVCYSGNITVQKDVIMSAGTYVFTGNLDFTGHGSLTGAASGPGSTPVPGVTLYFAGPNGQLGGPGNGNTTLNLIAPNSGPYNGILIYQDRTDAHLAEFNGTPITNLKGIIYMPDAPLEFSGNTVSNLTTVLIVNQLIEQGNATVNITNYNTTVSNSPLTTVALVE